MMTAGLSCLTLARNVRQSSISPSGSRSAEVTLQPASSKLFLRPYITVFEKGLSVEIRATLLLGSFSLPLAWRPLRSGTIAVLYPSKDGTTDQTVGNLSG